MKQNYQTFFNSWYTAIQLKSDTYIVEKITWMNPDVPRHNCWV